MDSQTIDPTRMLTIQSGLFVFIELLPPAADAAVAVKNNNYSNYKPEINTFSPNTHRERRK